MHEELIELQTIQFPRDELLKGTISTSRSNPNSMKPIDEVRVRFVLNLYWQESYTCGYQIHT